MQALENAYDLVQPGGYIYVDDYGSFEGCRRAVDVFKASVEVNAPLIPIFEHDNVAHFEAVWWRKPRYSTDEHLTYFNWNKDRFGKSYLCISHLEYASSFCIHIFETKYEKYTSLKCQSNDK